MPRLTTLATTSSLVFLLGSPMAMAELTAEGVWTDWKDYMSSFGYEMSGSESATASGLEVTDISISIPIPDAEGAFSFNLGSMTFAEEDDGSVRIDMGESIDFDFAVAPEGEEAVSGTLTFSQSDYSLIASGTAAETTYSYSAGTANLSMDGLTVDGESVGSEALEIDIDMTGISSVNTISGTDLRTFSQEMAIQGVAYSVNINGLEEDDETLAYKGQTNNMGFSGTGSLPPNLDVTNAKAMLDAGFAFDGGYTFGGGSTEFTYASSEGSGTFNTTGTGGTLTMAMSAEGLNYKATQNGMTVNALTSDFPFPVSFAAEKAGFDLLLPTVKKPDAQDLGMLISFENFTMADTLWGLFDPSGQLPRDPATISADVTGTAKLLFDYLDPTQAALLEQTGAAPGELESLSLKSLIVDVAGARLTGQGDFTFDNSDLVTFQGMPRPEGAVDLQLNGGNGLLDKLVAIGLLPQDQAMGARMMMGLFARPGEGEDSLVSKIEVNSQGHVLANGQRIQ